MPALPWARPTWAPRAASFALSAAERYASMGSAGSMTWVSAISGAGHRDLLRRPLTPSVSGFHPVETQELEQRHVLRGEQDGRLGARVDVGVPRPGRDHEEIARLPLEGLIVHRGRSPPAHNAIDGGARLAVGARADARAQELQVARDCRPK